MFCSSAIAGTVSSLSLAGTALNLWSSIVKCITKLVVIGNHNKHFDTFMTSEILAALCRFALSCCFLLQVRSANGGNRFRRTVGTDQRHYRRRSTSLRHLSVHNPSSQPPVHNPSSQPHVTNQKPKALLATVCTICSVQSPQSVKSNLEDRILQLLSA